MGGACRTEPTGQPAAPDCEAACKQAARGNGVVLHRALAFTLTFFALLGLFAPRADARPERHAAMILDANTGAILHNEDGDAIRHPASLTKMMTLYLTF